MDRFSRVEIGAYTSFDENMHIGVSGEGIVRIGDHVYFNRNCTVVSHNLIQIGNETIFGPNVCIYDHNHCLSAKGYTQGYQSGAVEIGNHCWIGAGCIILRNAKIGDGCVIGAGVVVSGDIPAFSIVKRKEGAGYVVERLRDWG